MLESESRFDDISPAKKGKFALILLALLTLGVLAFGVYWSTENCKDYGLHHT